MKKLLTMLIMALMLVSLVPAVFALDVGADVGVDTSTEVSSGDSVSVSSETSTEAKVRTGATDKTRLQIVKSRVSLAKENVADLRARVKLAKEDLVQTRKEWKEARVSGNAEVAFEAGQKHLIAGLDRMITHMSEVKARIEAHENYPQKARAVEAINAKIDYMTELKAKAEVAETKEELKESAKETRTEWMQMQKNIKMYVGHMMNARLDAAIEKTAKLNDRLDAKLDALEAKGEDVADLRTELSAAIDLSAKAEIKYNEAQKIFASIDATSEDAKAKFEQGKALVKEAAQDLKEAHAQIRAILAEMKTSMRANVKADANAEASVEQ